MPAPIKQAEHLQRFGLIARLSQAALSSNHNSVAADHNRIRNPQGYFKSFGRRQLPRNGFGRGIFVKFLANPALDFLERYPKLA